MHYNAIAFLPQLCPRPSQYVLYQYVAYLHAPVAVEAFITFMQSKQQRFFYRPV
jgi:hypothetical protein